MSLKNLISLRTWCLLNEEKHLRQILLLALTLGAFATLSAAQAQVADLAIGKTDGLSTAVPGTAITYTIVVQNLGPDTASGATVSDSFPPALLGVVWTCSPSPGATCTPSGSGAINDSVHLPAGASVTYTVNATIDAGATGLLTNTATVSPPIGVTDPNSSNNASTDSDTLTPTADLGITKTDFSPSATPGTVVTYTITVFNNGPSHAPGAQVSDVFPPSLQGVSWTCSATPGSSCSAGGTGNIADTVTLRAGGVLTYSVYAFIDPSATGLLVNTANVVSPPGVTDPGPASNTASDTDVLTPEADLAVSKTNGVNSVTAGLSTTYQILVTNAGPSDAPDTEVQDFFPPELVSVSWTCVASGGASCPPAGNGDIDELVDLPVGGSVLFTVTATIDPCASGTLTNLVAALPDPSVFDPNPTDNSASDADSIVVFADLTVSVSDTPDPVLVCNLLEYEITVRNNGPSCASGVTVTNTLPAGVSFQGTDGACSVSGNTLTCSLSDLDPGEEDSLQIVGLVDRSLRGAVVVDQTSVSAFTTDPLSANNALATSTEIKSKDPYVVSLNAAPRYLRIGGVSTAEYQVRVTSLCHPSVASSDLIVSSVLPQGLSFISADPAPTVLTPDGPEFDLPVLSGGESATLNLKARLNEHVEPGAELVHTVMVTDSLGLGGSASRTLYVRPLPDTRGKLVVKLAVPKKIAGGVQLPLRLVLDNKSASPAPDVETILVVPSGLTLLWSDPPPTLDLDFGDIRELRWNFPSVQRKQVIRLVQQLPGDLFPGEVLNFVAEAEDGNGNFTSNRRDVIIRLSPRARP